MDVVQVEWLSELGDYDFWLDCQSMSIQLNKEVRHVG